MANEQCELAVEMIFAEEGECAQDIISRSLRTFINRNLRKNVII